LVPFFTAFFSRMAMGSIPSFSASSSTALSTPNAEIGAPGAR
jgi:hypothetical protein